MSRFHRARPRTATGRSFYQKTAASRCLSMDRTMRWIKRCDKSIRARLAPRSIRIARLLIRCCAPIGSSCRALTAIASSIRRHFCVAAYSKHSASNTIKARKQASIQSLRRLADHSEDETHTVLIPASLIFRLRRSKLESYSLSFRGHGEKKILPAGDRRLHNQLRRLNHFEFVVFTEVGIGAGLPGSERNQPVRFLSLIDQANLI